MYLKDVQIFEEEEKRKKKNGDFNLGTLSRESNSDLHSVLISEGPHFTNAGAKEHTQ